MAFSLLIEELCNCATYIMAAQPGNILVSFDAVTVNLKSTDEFQLQCSIYII